MVRLAQVDLEPTGHSGTIPSHTQCRTIVTGQDATPARDRLGSIAPCGMIGKYLLPGQVRRRVGAHGDGRDEPGGVGGGGKEWFW